MKPEDEDLIDAARSVLGILRLREDFSAGTVGAAVRTTAGNIYTGICVDLACGLGFCAETAAVAEMLKHRETQIEAVAAVGTDGVLMGPCGRCREMMAQVDQRNLDCKIMLPEGKETILAELLPGHWLDDLNSSKPVD
jgi:cytidine deaminase